MLKLATVAPDHCGNPGTEHPVAGATPPTRCFTTRPRPRGRLIAAQRCLRPFQATETGSACPRRPGCWMSAAGITSHHAGCRPAARRVNKQIGPCDVPHRTAKSIGNRNLPGGRGTGLASQRSGRSVHAQPSAAFACIAIWPWSLWRRRRERPRPLRRGFPWVVPRADRRDGRTLT